MNKGLYCANTPETLKDPKSEKTSEAVRLATKLNRCLSIFNASKMKMRRQKCKWLWRRRWDLSYFSKTFYQCWANWYFSHIKSTKLSDWSPI